MNRTICFKLNHVPQIPARLRKDREINQPADEVEINLGQLFLQYYFDSFPAGPPNPDPTRFGYLELIGASDDFRFHAFVAEASTVKKRSISAEIGQAFCRLMLHDHFGVVYFAHMKNVLNKSTHAAFDGLRIERTAKGDVPDYLCAKNSIRPFIAEAKGRFESVAFASAEFAKWRKQFDRIQVLDRGGVARRVKGYVVGTRFATDANAPSTRTCCFVEDPETRGESALGEGNSGSLGRAIVAIHYSRIFSKLGLSAIASALSAGYHLTRQLTFQVPVWTCMSEPFQGRKFIGGFYRTTEGACPTLTEKGWVQPFELGQGHLAFVGLELDIAKRVAAAARESWELLDRVEQITPEGLWSSEFSWLLDGTVAAPAVQFLPTGFESF